MGSAPELLGGAALHSDPHGENQSATAMVKGHLVALNHLMG